MGGHVEDLEDSCGTLLDGGDLEGRKNGGGGIAKGGMDDVAEAGAGHGDSC